MPDEYIFEIGRFEELAEACAIFVISSSIRLLHVPRRGSPAPKAVSIHVLRPGQLGGKTRAQFQQREHLPVDLEHPMTAFERAAEESSASVPPSFAPRRLGTADAEHNSP